MDDKRFYRELKQQVKKTGNRKRRRFLKDVSADPGDFEFGSAESSAFNGRDGKRKRVRHGRPETQEETNQNPVGDLANSDDAGKTNQQEGV
jgi:hypothetical protein